MSYIRKIIIVLVFFNSSLCFGEDIDTFIVNSLNKHCKSLIDYEILETKKEGKIYRAYLKNEAQILPIYTNGEWIIVGSMFVSNMSITGGELDRLHKQNFLNIKDKLEEYIRFEYTPTEVLPANEFLYLIYDANCSYCNEIRPKLKYVCDKYRISLKIVLSSLASKPSDEIVGSFDSEARFLDFITPNFGPEQILEKAEIKKIEEATEILRDAGIFSTPTFIFSQTGEAVHKPKIQHLEERILNHLKEGKRSG